MAEKAKTPLLDRKDSAGNSVAATLGVIGVVVAVAVVGWWERDGMATRDRLWASGEAWLAANDALLRLVGAGIVAALIGVFVLLVWQWPRINAWRIANDRHPDWAKGYVYIAEMDGRKVKRVRYVCASGFHPHGIKAKKLAEIHGLAFWGADAHLTQTASKVRGRTQLDFTAPADASGVAGKLMELTRPLLPTLTSVDVDRDRQPTRVTLRYGPTELASNEARVERVENALVRQLDWEPFSYQMSWNPPSGSAELRRWDDPLATTVPALPYPDARHIDLAAVTVGILDSGLPWRLNLTGGRHLLIVGSTGSGKSSVVQSLVRHLAPGVDAGWVQLIGIDPKNGMELGPVAPLFSELAAGKRRSVGPAKGIEDKSEQALVILNRVIQMMDERGDRMEAAGQRSHVPTTDEPFVVLIIDELAMLTEYHGTAKQKADISQAVSRLCTQGRALGFVVIACVQDPRKDIVDFRDLFTVKIGMRLPRKNEVTMTLGDDALLLGARCDRINPKTPGVAFMVGDGLTSALRARAAFVTDRDIADMVDQFQAPRHKQPVEVDTAAPARPQRKRPVEVPPAPGEVIGETPVYPDRLTAGDWIKLDLVGFVEVVSVEDEDDDAVAITWKDENGVECTTSVDALDLVPKLLLA